MKSLLVFFASLCFIAAPAQTRVAQWPQAVTYEIFVQSFADSNGDGIGDIKGMTGKLDYLKDLGVQAVWLMPINPSPSYHKYDVTDYYGIHPDYGTMEDFKIFLTEAHKRNIKVVMDMVLNHSSNKHPWFLAASKDENNPYRDFYVWTHQDDPQTRKPARNTGADSDNSRHWHKVPGTEYLYYGFFSGVMPDLNFDNPRLRSEVFKIGKFWLQEVGVDGFRLDAARHLFPEERAHDSQRWWEYFLQEMRKVKPDVYIVGEVWATAPEVAPYLNGIPALFNFDLGFAITKAVNTGKGDSLAFRLQQIRSFYQQVNPQFTDAIFLTNHDQNRIMSAVGDDMAKAKLAAALLFTLPGSPYMYYGEELGMRGKKPDEAIREPMMWQSAAKDKERTRWGKVVYNTDATLAPVAVQQKTPGSIYRHYKELIAMRNNSSVLSYGDLKPIAGAGEGLLAFTRTAEGKSLLVVHNLSALPATFTLPENKKNYQSILYHHGKVAFQNQQLKMAPLSTVVLQP